MSVRPFAWHDLITLYRCRRRVLSTDSELALTQGNPVGPLALLSHLDPTRGSFTGVAAAKNDQAVLMGRMLYTPGRRSAHISFLLPADDLNQPVLPELVEILAVQAASWGAGNLLAEVEESSSGLDPLRNSGFSVYGWQTVWQLPVPGGAPAPSPWQVVQPGDDSQMRTLYQQLVPLLVQAAEPYLTDKSTRLVYRQGKEILAYAEAAFGPQGVFIQPVIHPAVRDVEPLLAGLAAALPAAAGRPVYLAVRSYHAWIESTLAHMNSASAPRQALLVKHMAVFQRLPILARKSVREAYNSEASVPLIQHSTIHNN